MSGKILLMKGSDSKSEHALDSGSITIGKSLDCTIRVLKTSCSDRQAEVVLDEKGKVTLINHSTTNRTVFKNAPMTNEPVSLQDGETFEICGATFKYQASKTVEPTQKSTNAENIPPSNSAASTPARKAVKSSSVTPAKSAAPRVASHQATPKPAVTKSNFASSGIRPPMSRGNIVARKNSLATPKAAAAPVKVSSIPSKIAAAGTPVKKAQTTIVKTEGTPKKAAIPRKSIMATPHKEPKTPRAVTFGENSTKSISPVQSAAVEVAIVQSPAVDVSPVEMEEKVESTQVPQEDNAATPKKKNKPKKSKIMTPIVRSVQKTPKKTPSIEKTSEEVDICGKTESNHRAMASPVKAEIHDKAKQTKEYYANCPVTPRTKFIIGNSVPTPVEVEIKSPTTPVRSAPRLSRTPKTMEVDVTPSKNTIFENTSRTLFAEETEEKAIESVTAVEGEFLKSKGKGSLATPMRREIVQKAVGIITRRQQSQEMQIEVEAAPVEKPFESNGEPSWSDSEEDADYNAEEDVEPEDDDIPEEDEDGTEIDEKPFESNGEPSWSDSEEDADYNAEEDVEPEDDDIPEEEDASFVTEEKMTSAPAEESIELNNSDREEESEVEESVEEKDESFVSAAGEESAAPQEAESIYESAEESEEREDEIVPLSNDDMKETLVEVAIEATPRQEEPQAESAEESSDEVEGEKVATAVSAEKMEEEEQVAEEESEEEREEQSVEEMNEESSEVWETIREEKDGEGDRSSRKLYRLPARTKSSKYYKTITDPIDSSMIKKKMNGAEYQTVRDFSDDMELLFDNAITWNEEENLNNVTALRIIVAEQSKERFDFAREATSEREDSGEETEEANIEETSSEEEEAPKVPKSEKKTVLRRIQSEITVEEADETAVTTPRTRRENRKKDAEKTKVEKEEEEEEEAEEEEDEMEKMVKELEELRVVDLRAESKKRGINTAGRKAELIVKSANARLGR